MNRAMPFAVLAVLVMVAFASTASVAYGASLADIVEYAHFVTTNYDPVAPPANPQSTIEMTFKRAVSGIDNNTFLVDGLPTTVSCSNDIYTLTIAKAFRPDATPRISIKSGEFFTSSAQSGCTTVGGTPSPGATVPGKPTGITASAGATPQTQVNLSWTAPSNGGATITKYLTQYSTDQSTWSSGGNVTGNPAATSHTITGLSANTQYYFRVAAENSVGTGSYSDAPHTNHTTSATAATVPDKPTGITASNGNPAQTAISLSWTAPSNGGSTITKYLTQYSTNNSTWSSGGNVTGNPAATSHTITGLSANTQYYLRVAAENAIGTGSYSDPPNTTHTTAATTAPGKPTGITASAGATPQTQISLSWTAPSNGGSTITKYLTQYSTNNSTWSSGGNVTGNPASTSHTITGLVANTLYYLRVAAENSVGTGSYSDPPNTTHTTSATAATVPGKPTGITASNGPTPQTQVSLSWTAPSNGGSTITKYLIQYSTDQSSWTSGGNVTGNPAGTTHTVTGLTANTQYYFRVAAENSVGTGSYSDAPHTNHTTSATGSTTPGTPGTPTSLGAGTTAVYLEWTAPTSTGGSAITSYTIQYKTSSTSSWAGASTTTSTGTAKVVTGLTASTQYDFRVAATNANGTGSYSDSVSDTPADDVPSKVRDLRAFPHRIFTNGAFLVFTAPLSDGGPDLDAYFARYKENTSSTWTVVGYNVTAPTGSFTIFSGLTTGTLYDFQVRAVNSVGSGTWSDTASATPGVHVDPTNLAAANNSTNGRSIDLSWTEPAANRNIPDITDYVIQYRQGTSGDWTTFNDGESDSTSATVTNLTAGTSHQFQVAAKNTNGIGLYSSPASAVPGIPFAPTDLDASRKAGSGTSIDLSWTAAVSPDFAVTDYIIQYRQGTSGGWTTFNDGESSATTATVTGLTQGTSYQFQVAAKNTNGQGPYSSSASATPATLPGAPTGLNGTVGGVKRVSLVWNAPADDGGNSIIDYIVRYIVPGQNDWRVPTGDTVSPNTNATVGVHANLSLEFQVAAKNNIGTGPWSASATASPGSVPGQVRNLDVNDATGTSVTVSWVQPSNPFPAVTGYVIEYRLGTSGDWTTHNDNEITTGTTIGSLTGPNTYQFQVAAKNSIGQGPWTIDTHCFGANRC